MRVLLILMVRLVLAEVWEKDMSNEVYIEASSEGFVSVQLTCGKKRMVVEVEMEEDFDGVMYTRGSFMSKYVFSFGLLEMNYLICSGRRGVS